MPAIFFYGLGFRGYEKVRHVYAGLLLKIRKKLTTMNQSIQEGRQKKRERLIQLFTFEKPFHLKYARLKQEHKDDRPELTRMIADGLVVVLEKDRKWITYRYLGQDQKQTGGNG